MVKYTLLRKPTVAGWLTVPRQVKTILAVAIIVAMTFLVIARSSRNAKLAELYTLQATLADIFDLEMKYIRETQPPANDSWKSIGVPSGSIYSAYLDPRPEIVLDYEHANSSGERTWAEIRIIAVLPLELDGKTLSCYYKYRTSDGGTEIRHRPSTRVRAIAENWNLKFSAFFVLCDLVLPKNVDYDAIYNENHLPASVSLGLASDGIVGRPDMIPFVDVRYPKRGVGRFYRTDNFLTVCVPVFHHAYDQPLRLVEFIEYHLMLGARHLTFYNSSVSSNVNKVLKHYVKRGSITVLRWKLPAEYTFEKTLRVEGLFAALNDCLYRSSFHDGYEYVASVDVDEFLVPRVHDDFEGLMRFLDPPRPTGARNKQASFLFRNVFFYTMYEDDRTGEYSDHSPYLYTWAKTTRVKKADKAGFRSKFIVRGQDVVELGNHNVWEMRKGSSIFSSRFDEVAVNTDIATSHHYRSCEGDTVACYFKETERDTTARKYAKNLGKRVAESCQAIFKGAGCPADKDRMEI